MMVEIYTNSSKNTGAWLSKQHMRINRIKVQSIHCCWSWNWRKALVMVPVRHVAEIIKRHSTSRAGNNMAKVAYLALLRKSTKPSLKLVPIWFLNAESLNVPGWIDRDLIIKGSKEGAMLSTMVDARMFAFSVAPRAIIKRALHFSIIGKILLSCWIFAKLQ